MSAMSLGIPAPETLLKDPAKVAETLLISGGPTNVYPSAQLALQNPQAGTFAPSTYEIIEDIKQGLQYVFQTKNEWTIAMIGPALSAFHAILNNVLEPGDVVFVPTFGYWSEKLAEAAGRNGGIVRQIHKPMAATFSLEEIEEGIKATRPQIVIMVYGESSTGVCQKIDGVGDICRKYDCLLIVDISGAIGIVPFHFDKWKIDAAFCNSQKGLGSFVGLGPLSYGPRAVAKCMARKTQPQNFFTDLNFLTMHNIWGVDKSRCRKGAHGFLHLLHALRASLSEIAKEGLENVWKRHEMINTAMCTKLEELGLESIVPNVKDKLMATAVLQPPPGVQPGEFKNYVYEKFGLYISDGTGNLGGKVIRLALIGPNANTTVLKKTINGIQASLQYFHSRQQQDQ